MQSDYVVDSMCFVTPLGLEPRTPTLSVDTRTRTWIDRIVYTTVLLIIEEHLPPHPSDIISWRWYTIPRHINNTCSQYRQLYKCSALAN